MVRYIIFPHHTVELIRHAGTVHLLAAGAYDHRHRRNAASLIHAASSRIPLFGNSGERGITIESYVLIIRQVYQQTLSRLCNAARNEGII